MVRLAHRERGRAEIGRGALGTNAWFASNPWAQRAHPTAFSRYRPPGGGYSTINLQVNNRKNTPLTTAWQSLARKSH